MQAGLSAYPVGKLVGAGTPDSKVVFFEPPRAENSRSTLVRYHNLLVDLCQITARRFSTLLAETAQKMVVADGEGDDREADNSGAPGAAPAARDPNGGGQARVARGGADSAAPGAAEADGGAHAAGRARGEGAEAGARTTLRR